ncbi:hypothetical protein LTS08_008226 [Lithohypha guttulata]|nr:hypothetical protein LTS08_008226 [Lithohypha guttulata]
MDAREENPLNATPETSRVVISNYVCMGVTLIVLVTRVVFTNLRWKRKFGLDDVLLYLALLAAIIESALTEHAVRRGMGTYIRPGNASKLKWLSQLVYASDLIFLVAMILAKFSLVRLVYRIASRAAIAKGKLMVLQILIAVWGTFALPAIAFQCGGSLPWLYIPDRCTASGSLWYPTLILSILLDAWLAVCVWTALPDMQIAAKQRQTILGLFGSRFITCVLEIVQIALLAPALKDINQPRAMPNPTVLKQFVMNASILSAAVPVLYKVLATYTPAAQAVVYNGNERDTNTPLEEIKRPTSIALPNPKKFDGFVKETEVESTPRTEKDNFSSSAFDKEISAISSRI